MKSGVSFGIADVGLLGFSPGTYDPISSIMGSPQKILVPNFFNSTVFILTCFIFPNRFLRVPIFLSVIGAVLSSCGWADGVLKSGAIPIAIPPSASPPNLSSPDPSPISISYTNPTGTILKGSTSIIITPVVVGSVNSYSVNPSLPAGLSLDSRTGVISGVPAVPLASTTFTLTATGQGVAATANISLEVAVGFTVNTTTDTSDSQPGDGNCMDSANQCSLRAALEEAAALTGVLSIVNLPAGTYGLASQALSINSRLMLTGAGSAKTIIDGNPDATPLAQLLTVGDYEVTLDGIAFKNASSFNSVLGKGISAVSGQLTLKNCLVQNNSGYGAGGGLYLSIPDGGVVTISNCIFDGNSLLASPNYAQQGGGIYATTMGKASISISNSMFSNNTVAASGFGASHGGGASFSGAGLSVTIDNTTFSGNTAANLGGAAYFGSTHTTTLTNSLFQNNVSGYSGTFAGGALNFFNTNSGTDYVIRKTTFSNNSSTGGLGRGGILAANGNGSIDIDSSTFAGPTTTTYSVYFLGMTGVIKNSTFSTDRPVGISNTDTLLFSHNTFSMGTSTALSFFSVVGPIQFFGNIFATSGAACAGPINAVSHGYNISSDASCTFMTGIGDLISTTASLAALASNGGPTQTIAIGAGSAARDIIPSINCHLGVDQRGNPRPNGGSCDAGAYEY